jgi:phosphopantothenoylcysteine decarboxylase/phosphopantothenate--cysteine ligase
MLDRKKILMVIGGGIAAYKSLDLIRQLRAQGATVTVILTAAASRFISPLSAASLSGQRVYTELFSDDAEAEIGHIALSRSSDLILVAPMTADLMAKTAQGHADDLASTVLLASDRPIIAAPSMNARMWEHPSTQRNLSLLKTDGVLFVGPEIGDMACGEHGSGRLADTNKITHSIIEYFHAHDLASIGEGSLAGKSVLITAGPTHEPIDTVRYIANRSSGKQGYALAAAARRAGAKVTLISGPTTLKPPAGVNTVHVETAEQMYVQVIRALPADIFIACAAVADWRVEVPLLGKLKKSVTGPPELKLIENPDILASVGKHHSRPKLVVGFAAETEDVLLNAKEKIKKKGCDIIIANDVSVTSGVMGGDENTVHVIGKTMDESWPKTSKDQVAERLIGLFSKLLKRGVE